MASLTVRVNSRRKRTFPFWVLFYFLLLLFCRCLFFVPFSTSFESQFTSDVYYGDVMVCGAGFHTGIQVREVRWPLITYCMVILFVAHGAHTYILYLFCLFHSFLFFFFKKKTK